MTKRSLAAAPAAVAFQQTLPPIDVAGVLADLSTLRTLIAETNRRYRAALAAAADAADSHESQERLSSPAAVYRLLALEMASVATVR